MPIFYSNGNASHFGLVLDVYERDNSLMEYTHSDATVWNPDTGKPESIHLWSRHWGGASSTDRKSATVDATPEVKAAYRRHVDLVAQTYDTIRMYHDSLEIKNGSTVKVVSGKKIKKGTVGTVTRVGRSGYGPWAIVNGTLTAQHNLEAIPDFSWWTG